MERRRDLLKIFILIVWSGEWRILSFHAQWRVGRYYDITNQYTIKRRKISLQTEV